MSEDVIQEWKKLRKSLIDKNESTIPDGFIKELFTQVEDIKLMPNGTNYCFYRARVGRYASLPESEMMNPPAHKAKAGRCNREGVSYLYLSDEETTSIQEVVKDRKEERLYITLGTFNVDISKIFSFIPYQERYMVPFVKTKEIETLLNIINDEMKRNVINSSEYVPLQCVTEYIRSLGYEGFMYSSVVGTGINLVMFDISKCTLKKRYEKYIVKAEYIKNDEQ